MKIEGNRVQPELASARLDPSGSDRARAKGGVERAGTDRVQLSTDAETVNTAMRAAMEAPDIRQELVEQARQKLAAGQLGKDLLHLADLLIDDAITSR
ncbi:MAG TPA: flagellar biosynthesis anti-sigma factor FlgM [Vicinamibacterales bacterium]|nr:flagellar biosynthesis anti-sigma factor FlgM [Vicinamibacterales bacterium]